jgi:hypothetical protein
MLAQPDDTAPVPPTLPVPVAGVMAGWSIPTAYRMANTGALPLLPVPGRQRVVTARWGQMLGIEITAAMVASAREQVALKTKKAA